MSITDEQIEEMKELYKTLSLSQVAELFGINKSQAQYLIGRKPKPNKFIIPCLACGSETPINKLMLCKNCFIKAQRNIRVVL